MRHYIDQGNRLLFFLAIWHFRPIGGKISWKTYTHTGIMFTQTQADARGNDLFLGGGHPDGIAAFKIRAK